MADIPRVEVREPTEAQLAVMPNGAFKFMAKEVFDYWRDDELIARYDPAMNYTCVPGKPMHDVLRKQCAIWFDEGRIFVIPLRPMALVSQTTKPATAKKVKK